MEQSSFEAPLEGVRVPGSSAGVVSSTASRQRRQRRKHLGMHRKPSQSSQNLTLCAPQYLQFHEIAATSWQRFALYAESVRTLTYDEHRPIKNGIRGYITPATFTLIAAAAFVSSGLPRTLLPRLRTFNWLTYHPFDSQNMPPIAAFLSPSIVNLKFTARLPDDRQHAEGVAEGLWKALGIVGPELTDVAFEVSPMVLDQPWDAGLCRWLSTRVYLERVTLPQQWRGDVVAALGALPRLTSIKEETGWWWSGESSLTSFLQVLGRDLASFPSLATLYLEVTAAALIRTLRARRDFSTLRSLSLELEPDTDDRVQEMFSVLSQSCPSLSELNVGLTYWQRSENLSLSFGALQPLLNCSALTCINLELHRPILLQEAEIRMMGEAWRNMTTFVMNVDFDDYDPDGLPFSTLTAFAQAFPVLCHLHLPFNPSSPIPSIELSSESTPFQALKTLHVDRSPSPENALDAALFIASLCRSDVRLEWDSVILYASDEGRKEEWRSLDNMFKRVVRAKELWSGKPL